MCYRSGLSNTNDLNVTDLGTTMNEVVLCYDVSHRSVLAAVH